MSNDQNIVPTPEALFGDAAPLWELIFELNEKRTQLVVPHDLAMLDRKFHTTGPSIEGTGPDADPILERMREITRLDKELDLAKNAFALLRPSSYSDEIKATTDALRATLKAVRGVTAAPS